jgi:antitoxin component of MazEF toxin-antitoxin module
METLAIPLARIGNSRGIRLPAHLIRKMGFDTGLLLEDHGDSLVLKPQVGVQKKLSWDETAQQMAIAHEDWSDWVSATTDGLEFCAWEPVKSKKTKKTSK